MIIGQQVRAFAFWGTDRFRGGLVRRHLADVAELAADESRRERATRERLKALFEHAATTTRHYAPYRGATRLQDFPVLQKRQIQEDRDAFISSAFSKKDVSKAGSSGSYGAPLIVPWSKDKRARQLAELIHFTGWMGWKVGMPFLQIRAKPQSRLHQFIVNERVLNPTHMSPDFFRKGRGMLGSARFIMGYPSGAHALADYCRAQGDTPASFRAVGACLGGEPLTATARRSLEELLGCPVRSRYAANELGVVGQEPLEEPGRHVLNACTFVYELLDVAQDQPARPGELGRIVVTDLFSHALPLIRYETGDLGVLAERPQPGSGLPVLERLEGRQMDLIFDAAGNPMCSLIFFGVLEAIKKLLQFQVVQTDSTRYLLRCVVQPGFDQEAVVIEVLKKVLGANAEITLERVQELAPLPSGKRPSILNRMPQKPPLAFPRVEQVEERRGA